MRCFMLVCAVLAGCNADRGEGANPQQTEAPRKLAGVYPDQWRCDSVAPLDVLEVMLGGTIRAIESPASVPRGLPRPCNYEVKGREVDIWTFDVDCRDGMKQRADALFAQYRETASEAVARYAQLDAGVGKPGDAGVARAPEPAVPVTVGAKGLDHHGDGLIFIDDDAPCYVRVAGKDAARRLELAKLIAKNLTPETAPMVPRAQP
jgi:hypothetical protein